MKTVLKRTFSLLLVMIMLVSVLPVAVSADDVEYNVLDEVTSTAADGETLNTKFQSALADQIAGDATFTYDLAKATYTPKGGTETTTEVPLGTDVELEAGTDVKVTFYEEKTYITTTIVKDGETLINGLKHEATVATTVGDLLTKYDISDTGCVVSPAKDTPVNPDSSVTITVTTDNSKTITLYYKDTNGQGTSTTVRTNLNNQLDAMPNPDNIANNESFKGWYDDAYSTTGEMLTTGTNVRGNQFWAHYETNYNNERDTVKIYAVVYVGGAYKTTVGPLVEDDAVIRGTNTLNLLNNKLSSVQSALDGTKYSMSDGYELEDTIVFYDDQGLTDKITQTDTVKSNDNYYVRVNYTNNGAEVEEVQIYVHTAKKNDIARTITLKTYAPGEIITKSIVNAAVKKYYNVSNSNIFMYKEDSWKQIVAGNSSTDQDTEIEVLDGVDTKIHVYLKGSVNNSDNPKTGDIIMMAVTVLAISGAALAVVFYLNKKKKAK